MTEITMPKLSDSMEEGTILSWLKSDGEMVEEGEDLVEIETDKATVTHPAEAAGVLSIVAVEGTSLPVGATIARVGSGEGGEPAPETPATEVSAQPFAANDGQHPVGSAGVVLAPAAAAPAGGNGRHPGNNPSATPVARRAAAAHGVALDDLEGTGPLGRITRADVLHAAGIQPAPTPPAASPVAPATSAAPPRPPVTEGAKGRVDVHEPTRMQTVIARRMAEAKATVPHFQVQTEVCMDAAVALRAQLKATGAETVPSFNDMIVKASALALRAHPLANGAYRDGQFESYGRVNVGIAVAVEGALVVPTIFDADEKSLGAIASEARRLAAAVRDGSATPPELSGATFTVSNLGMYGMTAITPVINAPQAAILGVGSMREVLARVDDEIVDRTLMTLTLSCDHRILYGAHAAEFLSSIRDLLEQPLRLAL